MNMNLVPHLDTKTNRYGYTDRDNLIVIPHQFHFALPFYDDIAIVYLNEENQRLINVRGEIIQNLPIDNIYGFNNSGYSKASIKKNIITDEGALAEEYLLYGIIEKSHQIEKVIEVKLDFKYSYLSESKHGYFVSKKSRLFCENSLYGLIDSNYNESTCFVYTDIIILSSNIASVTLNGNKKFINPKNGVVLADNPYNFAYELQNGLIKVELKENFGFIDELGREIISTIFEFASDFYDDIALVKYQGVYFYIDKLGNKTTLNIDLSEANYAIYDYGKLIYSMKNDGGYFLINFPRKQSQVIPLNGASMGFNEYGYAEINYCDYTIEDSPDFIGIINPCGEEVLKLAEYESIKFFSQEFVLVEKEGLFAFFSLENSRFVTEFIFEANTSNTTDPSLFYVYSNSATVGYYFDIKRLLAYIH